VPARSIALSALLFLAIFPDRNDLIAYILSLRK
jgi:hypothetical protein